MVSGVRIDNARPETYLFLTSDTSSPHLLNLSLPSGILRSKPRHWAGIPQGSSMLSTSIFPLW
jgi:hypothetical protein